jgi:cyclophilin family peptidyl-prolyl cis-trans isomerase
MKLRLTAIALVSLPVLLAACGGGGGDAGGDGRATVSSANVSNIRYSQAALITINGENLDGTITVGSDACSTITRSTTAPNVSTATTAYYLCMVSKMGTQSVRVVRSSDAAELTTVPFNVPAPQVTMTVSNGAAVAGSMVITLAPDKTPITVDNFLHYVNTGFYDGTIFHRVVAGFVIQGGGYLPITTLPATLKTPTRPAIELEVNKGLSNTQWTIAMARTNVANSATSQFFINLVNNASILDPAGANAGYAVFGTVTGNTALASAIVGAPCTPVTGFSECVPNPNMVITSAVQTQ